MFVTATLKESVPRRELIALVIVAVMAAGCVSSMDDTMLETL